jgi:hypothetical protein
MDIEKSPLPKSMSYVMKSSVLDEALSQSSIKVDTTLRYTPGRFFDAHFWPPNPNVPHERVHVVVGAVPASAGHVARQYVKGAVIPEFISWLAGILSLPQGSPVRREKQLFSRAFPHGPSAAGA